MARLSLISALDTALARAAGRAATLGVSARLLVLGGFVVGLLAIPAIALGRFWIGFALADPSRALASCFALFGFVAFVSVRSVDALVEVICAILFAVACTVPGWFSLIAYALGIAC